MQVILVGRMDGLSPRQPPRSCLSSPAPPASPHHQASSSWWDQARTWASLTVSATLRPCTRTFMGSM